MSSGFGGGKGKRGKAAASAVRAGADKFSNSRPGELSPACGDILVTIDIQERTTVGPNIGLSLPGTTVLHASSRQPSSGGTLSWQVVGPQAAVQGPADGAQATILANNPGVCQVTLTHTVGHHPPAQATINLCIVSVTLDLQEVCIAVQGPNNSPLHRTVQANGQPPGGTCAWQLTPAAGIPPSAQFRVAPGTNNSAIVEAVPGIANGGQGQLQVTYTVPAYAGANASASIPYYVVSVSIQPQPPGMPLAVLKRYGGAYGLAAAGTDTTGLQANGAPAACAHPAPPPAYSWQALDPANIQLVPGAGANVAAVRVQAVAQTPTVWGPRAARFRASYSLHSGAAAGGATAAADVTVNAIPQCSQSLWNPAAPGAAAPAGNAIAPQPLQQCTHEGPMQQPGAPGSPWLNVAAFPPAPPAGTNAAGILAPAFRVGAPTANPRDPHHHGYVCPHCSANHHGVVSHWVDPGNAAGQASPDALALRNQFQSCGWVWDNAWMNPPAGTNPDTHAINQVRAHIVLQNWPWLQLPAANAAIDFGSFWSVPGAHGNTRRGIRAEPKMFGILRGSRNGQQYRLRAASGLVWVATPGNGAQHARLNDYWSPPTHGQRTRVCNATQAAFNYAPPPAGFDLGTLGLCAATKLLTHALHLGLRIESMAEIWIGDNRNVTDAGTVVQRQDGQLQASCQYCRRYIGRMLCEFGGAARPAPYAGAAAGYGNLHPSLGM